MQSSQSTKVRLIRALPGILAAALLLHFGITCLYLTPLNPIKPALIPALEGYMSPFFTQQWGLFAPNPKVDTRLLLVACKVVNEQGQVEERPWSNMTAPFRALKQKYRLTPADRLDRAQQVSVHMMYAKPDDLAQKLIDNPEDTPEYRKAVELIEQDRKTRKETGTRLMARVASAECDRINGEGKTREVRVRLITIKSPPFSQRWSPNEDGETSRMDFDWLPYEKVAAL
jgi:uncharacterized protein DUF5819